MRLRQFRVFRTMFAIAMLSLLPNILSAATITFGGLSRANGSPFPSPYTESAFVVTATAGNWVEGHVFGNPVPSIFDGAGFVPVVVSSILITEVGGGAFTFSSVDLASLGNTDFTITGTGFNEAGTVGPIQVFTTIHSNNTLLPLTALLITMSPEPGVSSYNIDNIVVNAVPEPTTYTLLGSSLSAFILLRRRLAKASVIHPATQWWC